MRDQLRVRFTELHVAASGAEDIPALGGASANLRVAGVLTIERRQYVALAAEVVRHVDQLREAVRINFGADFKRLSRLLQYPLPASSLLQSREEIDPFLIGRLDFVISNGQPRIVEFNMTSSLGGTTVIEKLHDRLASASGFSPPGFPNKARLNIAIEQLRTGASNRIYLPLWPWSQIADPEDYFSEPIRYLNELGSTVQLLQLSDLGDALDKDPEGVVLRLFDTGDALSAGIDLRQAGLGTDGKGKWVMGEGPNLISSKALMALQTLQTSVGGGQGHLAPTWLVEEPTEARSAFQSIDVHVLERDQMNYVLKPSYGHSGRRVVVGPHVSAAEWRAELSATMSQPYVAQRWFPPDLVSIAFRDSVTGDVSTADAPAVFGMYVIDGQAHGVYVRIMPMSNALGPINSSQGAVDSALMLQ